MLSTRLLTSLSLLCFRCKGSVGDWRSCPDLNFKTTDDVLLAIKQIANAGRGRSAAKAVEDRRCNEDAGVRRAFLPS